MKKRIIATTLALVMCLTMLLGTAMAIDDISSTISGRKVHALAASDEEWAGWNGWVYTEKEGYRYPIREYRCPQQDANIAEIEYFTAKVIADYMEIVLSGGVTFSINILFEYSSHDKKLEVLDSVFENSKFFITSGKDFGSHISDIFNRIFSIVRVSGGGGLKYLESYNTNLLSVGIDASHSNELISKLLDITASAKGHANNAYGQLEYINQYIIDNVQYGFASGFFVDSQNTYDAIITGKAVCMGYTRAISDLCFLLGIPNIIMLGQGEESHSWNCIYIDGQWKMLDTTLNDTSGQNKKYFLVDSINGSDHDYLAFDNIDFIERSKEIVIAYHKFTPEPISFSDIPSSWASAEVNAAIEAGLVPEHLQRNYTQPVSRGDVAQMFIDFIEKYTGQSIDEFLVRKGVSINNNTFTDTNDKSVLAANALGIINGVGGNRFEPEGTFTRAHVAAIFNRIANVLDINTSGYTHNFTDVAGHWVDSELGWSVHVEIIKGVGDNKFEPDTHLTTEQVIIATYRALSAIK